MNESDSSAVVGTTKYRVLIADDSADDRFFLRDAIQRHAPRLDIVAEVEDGDQVIAYLWGFGEFSDRVKHPLPDLLLMDVRMPRLTGIKVLEWLNTQAFPTMKVAVLADSSAVIFRDKAMSLGLKHFYPKTHDRQDLAEVVKKMQTELEQAGEGLFL